MIHFITLSLVWSLFPGIGESAENEAQSRKELLERRMHYYYKYQDELVPWYYLAAIDQYERNVQDVRKDIPKRESVVAIQYSDDFWSGALNPKLNDTSITTIKYFGGLGLDGNNDGVADANNDDDILYTMASFLSKYGTHEEDYQLALWDFYKNEQTVNQIATIAKLYKHYQTLDLDEHTFPVALGYNYSYRGTWGANRGWGGRRIHEGTDVFASYSTPVLSASYGVVEIMGWNQFGGWRIGIRDNHNSYHYYAHLAYFEKGLKVGDVVEPGQVIGYVGSTGYGKEGTSGKFPPHLHYGIYKFNGINEWAFDPYPSLVQWEKEAKKKKK
ncbi:M23 family metallopeptidase [Ureibacillus sp. NPDC094379]